MADHPNVFVSATRKDLEPYVKEVERILLKHSCFPIAMETFNPTALNALQLCYNKVMEADIFVGIYAHRYGFCPKKDITYKLADGTIKRGNGSTSITEWEYIWAKERGIPTLLFIVNDKDEYKQPFPWPLIYVDDEPNKSRLDKFKQQIKKDFVGFFTTPDDLAKRLSPALADVLKQKNLFKAYSANAGIVNVIPQPVLRVDRAVAQSPNSSHQNANGISVENPLLLGVLVDVSRSMLKLLEDLPSQSGISRNKLGEALNELAEKAILYCRTPEATQILPRFALFMYGFGFGRLRSAIANSLARLGITSENASGSIPESNVRDLFAEIAYKENIPTTPNAAELYEALNSYGRSLEAQIVDAGGGSSVLGEGLKSIEQRFKAELSHFNTKNALLLIVSDGQLDNATDEQLHRTAQRIRDLGVHILSCYVSREVVTAHRTLYANPIANWSIEAHRLFDCASAITQDNSIVNSLKEIALENKWNIPDGARMFVQINNNEMLQEVIEMVISPLKTT